MRHQQQQRRRRQRRRRDAVEPLHKHKEQQRGLLLRPPLQRRRLLQLRQEQWHWQLEGGAGCRLWLLQHQVVQGRLPVALGVAIWAQLHRQLRQLQQRGEGLMLVSGGGRCCGCVSMSEHAAIPSSQEWKMPHAHSVCCASPVQAACICNASQTQTRCPHSTVCGVRFCAGAAEHLRPSQQWRAGAQHQQQPGMGSSPSLASAAVTRRQLLDLQPLPTTQKLRGSCRPGRQVGWRLRCDRDWRGSHLMMTPQAPAWWPVILLHHIHSKAEVPSWRTSWIRSFKLHSTASSPLSSAETHFMFCWCCSAVPAHIVIHSHMSKPSMLLAEPSTVTCYSCKD